MQPGRHGKHASKATTAIKERCGGFFRGQYEAHCADGTQAHRSRMGKRQRVPATCWHKPMGSRPGHPQAEGHVLQHEWPQGRNTAGSGSNTNMWEHNIYSQAYLVACTCRHPLLQQSRELLCVVVPRQGEQDVWVHCCSSISCSCSSISVRGGCCHCCTGLWDLQLFEQMTLCFCVCLWLLVCSARWSSCQRTLWGACRLVDLLLCLTVPSGVGAVHGGYNNDRS